MTDQHTDEMREAFEKTLEPCFLEWSRWKQRYKDTIIQFRFDCFCSGYQSTTTRYQDALREASSILTEIASDSGEAFMYSENLRINRAITTINKLLREANG